MYLGSIAKVVQALSAFWDTQAVKTPKAELHIAVHVISKHKTQCSLEGKLRPGVRKWLMLYCCCWHDGYIYIITSVGFSGIGSYYMDGRAFLQCLGTDGKLQLLISKQVSVTSIIILLQ